MQVAFLFPGQGAQRPSMLDRLPQHPSVANTLCEASDLLAFNARTLDSEEMLASTVSVQLALFIAGVATARYLAAEGVQPHAVAGLSVGAFAAAVIAGAVSFRDGLLLVRKRAEWMEQAFPSGYGLSAIVGLPEAQVTALVERFHTEERPVYIGNINGLRQIIIAGSNSGMALVLDAARAIGARKADRLPVNVPSHCPLLSGIAQQLLQASAEVRFTRPAIPYISNRRARPLSNPDLIRKDVTTNIECGVRWYDSTEVLLELGIHLFVEMYPGHTLTTLLADSFPSVRALAAEDNSAAHIRKLAELTALD